MAIAFADSGIGMYNATTSITVTKNFSTVTNAYLVFHFTLVSSNTISAVTWNGASLTSLNTPSAYNGHKNYWYGIANPDLGASYDAVVTASGNPYSLAIALYSGASQAGQPDAVDAGGSGSGTTASGTITTVADNSIALMGVFNGGASYTAGANTTVRVQAHNADVGDACICDSAPISPAGIATLTVTFGAASYEDNLISLSPAAAASVPRVQQRSPSGGVSVGRGMGL